MNDAEQFDQFLDALRADPKAAPPAAMDAEDAAFIRALVAAEQRNTPAKAIQERTWHKALMLAQGEADSFNGRPPSKTQVEHRLNVLKPNERLNLEDDMHNTNTSLLPFSRVAPDTRPPTIRHFWQYTATIAASIFIIVAIGGLLIDMISDPIDGYPAIQALQTETPGCAVTTDDPQAESLRLAGQANRLVSGLDEANIKLAALLSLCALQTAPTIEADRVLTKALRRLELMPSFPGHTNSLNSAVFSPDGSKLLIAGFDRAHLWDIVTHTEIATFPGDTDSRIFQAVFSPDGQSILALTENGLQLWDAETGETSVNDFDTNSLVISLAYAPDGVHAAFGMWDGSVQLWNVQEVTQVKSFQVHRNEASALAFSPDGKSLLVGGDQIGLDVYLLNLETGAERTFSGLQDFSNGVAFSPDGQYVLAGGDTLDKTAILWDTETGEIVHTFSGFINDVNVVAFSPDGKTLLAGSADYTTKMFDVESGAEVRRFAGGENYVGSVAYSPDGKTVLVGIQSGQVRLWPTRIEDTITLACQQLSRDFTAEERAEFGLGEGNACQ